MHIWYIHHYGGGPGLGIHDRAFRLSQAWKKQGHTVTVFIAGFHHLMESTENKNLDFKIEEIDFIPVPARFYRGNGIKRIINIAEFSFNLHKVGRRYADKISPPEVIVTSSPHPFSIFSGYILSKRYQAKLIFEIRDIWPLSITTILKVSALHPFVQMCAFAEKFALKNADLISSVLPRADRYLADRKCYKPFVWVPNGITSDSKETVVMSPEGKRILEILTRWREDGNIIITHAGSMGKPNALDLLIEGLAYGRSAGKAAKCRLLLIGSGQEEDVLKQLTEALGLKDVVFGGRVPKNEVSTILRKTDIGYAGIRSHDALYKYGVALNKFADYYNARLPVILPINPCGDPVSESGGGIAKKAITPKEIWGMLEKLALMSSEERKILGEKGRSYMFSVYDYNVVAEKYINAIELNNK